MLVHLAISVLSPSFGAAHFDSSLSRISILENNYQATTVGRCLGTSGDGVGDACDVQQCGNSIQVFGEACEDGNVAGGDGCSATCTFDWTAGPVMGCVPAAQAQLDVNEKSTGKEKLKLQWKGVSAEATVADFGDPLAGSTVPAICLYADGGALAGSYVVDRSGDYCAGKPCWKAKGTKGLGLPGQEGHRGRYREARVRRGRPWQGQGQRGGRQQCRERSDRLAGRRRRRTLGRQHGDHAARE